MTRQSDLALEHFGFAEPVHAMQTHKIVRDDFHIASATLPNGLYHTILAGRIWLETAEFRRRLAHVTADLLYNMMGSCCRILVAGIGNPDVPSDALGNRACRRILVTGESSESPSLFAIQPGTSSRTGFDTAILLRCIANEIHPDVLIVTDALAAKSRTRLQTVLQISDAGLAPGSAIAHTAEEISRHTMPCPVISIGVPTVISTASLCKSEEEEPLLVTRADSDIITDCWASVIGHAINIAVFGK